MPTRRQQKVARVVKEAVSDAITNHLNDPRIEGFISVTRVEMAADLRSAEVFISMFGSSEAVQNRTFIAITHAKSRIQSLLRQQIKSKFCPALNFHIDQQIKKALETLNIINQVTKELKDKEAAEGPEDLN